MPIVPTYSSPQVAPASVPAAYDPGLNSRLLAEGAANSGRQLQSLGRAIQGVGDVATNEAVDAQMMANQVRVDAALNQVRQAQQDLTYDPQNGYAVKKGAAALDPDPLGRSLPQQYGEQLQDTISSVSAGLGNDAQRRVFTEQANGIATQFTGNVQRHMMQEFTNFGLETQQGTIKLAADSAKLNWSNPDQIAPQIESAKAAVWKAGQISGEPANLTAAKIQATTSAIHTGVIDAALQNNNPAYALAYIEAKKGEMTADDLLKANSIVKQDVRARVATGTAMAAMNSLQTRLAPTDADRVKAITAQTESNNRETNPDGSVVTSSAGAKGSMQVMDATNKDPGYGVKPAQDDSLAERKRVGQDYIMALAKNYGGDMAKAWAAYNAGPGTVDKAIAAAAKSGSPGGWMDAMAQFQTPAKNKETTNYVATNMAALQKQQTTSAPIPSMQDVHDNIRTQLGPNPDPRLLQASLAEGTRQYEDFMKNRKTQGENATVAAQQWLIQNNGNMAALPPNLASAVTQFAPDKYDNLVDFSKKIAKGENVTHMPAYLDAVAHPEDLAKMPDSVFNHFVTVNFSQTDGKQIAKLRQDEINGKDDQSAGSLNRPALNTALNSRLTAIGINPTPKDLGEKARVGSIQKFVTDGIFQQQQQLGRKMTAQEVSDYVDTTMAKNVQFRSTFLGFDTGATQQNLMNMKVADIPSASLTSIRTALAQAGNTKPTDDQILRTYWTSKSKNGR